MINVCVPVLKRYDLLHGLLQSLQAGTVRPDTVYVIDNGRRLWGQPDDISLPVRVFTPTAPMGVAESWNWFIRNVPERRVIANDDVLFAPQSLEQMARSQADLAWASGFSCFLIRDACVQKIGLFDEAISPGYGYYEDEDYLQRLDGRGTRERSAVAENLDCGVVHLKSQTLQAATHEEALEHHRRFEIARRNYMRKWNVSDEEMFGVRPAKNSKVRVELV